MTLTRFGMPVELAAGDQETQSPEVEVLRTGVFVSFYGQEVTINDDDLAAFVEAFDGGVAGQQIPFDIDHEFAEAAGWVTSLRHANNRLYATPEWNELGRELISTQRYKYLSAAIDLVQRVVKAISLVNFPAVKGLAPLTLSERQKIGASHPLAQSDFAEVFFSVQENSNMTVSNTASTKTAPPAERNRSAAADAGAADVTTTPAETTTPAATTPAATTTPTAPAVFSAETLQAAVAEQVANEMTALRDMIKQEMGDIANLRTAVLQETMATLRAEQELAAFAHRVTSTGRNALPVTPDALSALLSSLPPAHRKSVMDLLSTIADSGLVNFTEQGTELGSDGKRNLDADMAKSLRAFQAEGGTVEQFFTANADLLGPISNWHLNGISAEKTA